MTRSRKRLSLALIVIMIISMLPMSALAASPGNDAVDADTYELGDAVTGTEPDAEAEVVTADEMRDEAAAPSAEGMTAMSAAPMNTTAPAVTLSVAGGLKIFSLTETASITVTGENADAVYYTVDGSDPTTGSTEWTEGVISVTTPGETGGIVTIRAIAVGGELNSETATVMIAFYPHEKSASESSLISLTDGDNTYYFINAAYAFDAADRFVFDAEITLKLLQSFTYTSLISINNHVKLDLNGKTLTINRSDAGTDPLKPSIDVLGKLTVTDTSASGSAAAGTIDFSGNTGIYANTSNVDGESIAIENGTLQNASKTANHYVLRFAEGTGTFEMSGGKAVGRTVLTGDGTINISGGVFEAGGTENVLGLGGANILITGGEFVAPAGLPLAASTSNPMISINPGTVTSNTVIRGGTFTNHSAQPTIQTSTGHQGTLVFDGPAEFTNTVGPALRVVGTTSANTTGSVTITEDSDLKLSGGTYAVEFLDKRYSSYTGAYQGVYAYMPPVYVSGGHFACGDGYIPISDTSYATFPNDSVLNTAAPEGYFTFTIKASLGGTYDDGSGESYTYQDFDGKGLGDTGLDGLIEEAVNIYGVTGAKPDAYSQALWDALTGAYAAAVKVKTNANANQNEIDFYAAALIRAMQSLASSTGIDVANLPDGTYRVPLTMYKSNLTGISMAAGAIGEDATLVMKDGKGKLSIHFKPANVLGFWGHVLQWWLLKGDTPEAVMASAIDPNSDVNRAEAVYTDTYRHANDASDAIVTYNPDHSAGLSPEYPYVGTATIDMPYFGASGGYQYIYCHVGVDAMRDIASNYEGKNGDASMAVAPNWGELRAENVPPALTTGARSVSLLKGASYSVAVGTDFAEGYTLSNSVVSGNSSVATAEITGSEVTVTAVGAGETDLTVAAAKSGSPTITAKIHVTVAEDSAVVVDVKDVAVKGGVAYATVFGDTLVTAGGPEAVINGKTNITVDTTVSVSESVGKAVVTLEPDAVRTLSFSGKGVTIKSNAGDVTFDAAAMSEIAGAADPLVLTLEKRTQPPAINSHAFFLAVSYDISLTANGADVPFGSGRATVYVPTAGTNITNGNMNFYAYHVKDGKLLDVQQVNPQNNMAGWTTRHFSTWAIIFGLHDLDEAEGGENPGGGDPEGFVPGDYKTDIKLWKFGLNEPSMGNGALKHEESFIRIKDDGTAEAHIFFKALTFTGLTGHLENLSLVTNIARDDGIVMSYDKTPAAVISDYSGTADAKDTYGPIKASVYPREVSIPVEIGETYTIVEVFVPVMEQAVGGAGTQLARIRIDWSALGIEENPEPPPATESPVSNAPEGSATVAAEVTQEVKTTTEGKVVESTVAVTTEAVTQAATGAVNAAKSAAEARNANATETVVAEVRIAAALPAGTNANEVVKTEVIIPKEVVAAVLSESDKVKAENESAGNTGKANVEIVLTVESAMANGLASVTLDAAMLAQAVSAAGETAETIAITVTANATAMLTFAQQAPDVIPVGKVPIAVTISAGDEQITELASEIAITIPYVKTSGSNKKVVVWYVSADGNKIKHNAVYDNGRLTFVTDKI
jgi:hypothetical protein